ncbi:hypothetical protein HDU97_005389 [Phlyctochytrium planicorne]|nr:hypothetical protein HDU97_005389 [Phlyctochytrium planicorne]
MHISITTLLCILLSTILSTSTMGTTPPSSISHIPPTIILIRHAEKLTWSNGLQPEKSAKALYIDNHILSAKGFERSHALAGYFLHRQEMQSILARSPLAAIIAQGVDESGKGKSERPRQTVEPLAWILASTPGLAARTSRVVSLAQVAKCPPYVNGTMENVVIEYKKKDAMKLVERLTVSGEFSGRTVIVSWSHQQLPALAVALGVPRENVPGKWGKRFDMTWVLEPVRVAVGRPTMRLHQLPQRLLYGDSDEIFEIGEGFQYDEKAILAADDDGDE